MKEQNFKQSVEEKSADKEFNHHQITKMIINNSLFFFFLDMCLLSITTTLKKGLPWWLSCKESTEQAMRV